jgi:hypothetical protein
MQENTRSPQAVVDRWLEGKMNCNESRIRTTALTCMYLLLMDALSLSETECSVLDSDSIHPNLYQRIPHSL